MKYYVMTDVHGFYTELITALTEKGFFEENEPRKLVVCGDLFDRGKEAAKLQDFIVDLLKKDEVILIRGNHEDLTEELVEDYYHWEFFPITNSHHWSNGTVDTVFQLTGMDARDITMNARKMKLCMENTPYFKEILPAMVNYYETEHYIFVHGWIPCHSVRYSGGGVYFTKYDGDWRKATEDEWRSARWQNGMEAARQGVIEGNKTIVCGHVHCSYGHAYIERKGTDYGEGADYSPYYSLGVIGLDGCTVVSGKVNCIVVED